MKPPAALKACALDQTNVNLAGMDTGFTTGTDGNFSLRRAVARNGF